MMMKITTKAWAVVVLSVLSVSLLKPSDAFSSPLTGRRSSPSCVTVTTTPSTGASSSSSSTSSLLSAATLSDDIPISSLPLPPQKGGLFRRFRDTISYIRDPEQFIERRSKELGPVFTMYQFFMPVVVVGGQDAVQEFVKEKEKEGKVIYSALPPTFAELHTKWGALNLDSTREDFKQARGLFKGLLQSTDARAAYVQTILPEIERYVDTVVDRVKANPEEELFLVPELKDLCLQIFSRIFSGEGLSKEQVQMFLDYNAALLSLSKNSNQYKKGQAALESLSAEMLHRFRKMESKQASNEASSILSPDMLVLSAFQNQEGYVDVGNYERISVSMVLLIWGAYVECASLMVDSAVNMIMQRIDPTTTVLREMKELETVRGLNRTDLKYWDGMKYTTGILRESLRLVPPGAGVPRYGEVDISLGGYRIPAGKSIMLDPRIGNRDPTLFEQAEIFEPLRWVPNEGSTQSSSSSSSCPFAGTALRLGVGSWFPGGNGAHRCPGIPLAELVSTMFLASLSEKFVRWELSGSGLTNDGSKPRYVEIPIKICPDDLGLKFTIRD